ncbi:hypothetical protein TBLA_0A08120 [Henningerozyma blattae CBS 6284]|uniref:Transcription factor MBP1 n=1 Tax=Henningerozyma blattae (strain ATCC 34711 / CBS 6284 / DSM 70876 / NBRC 10599 / NRRL Y-10934 / UCD 77-7) TaxID=1071380 RepID=I2GWV0_HENB6|nr:hypothetical protein TBLA_0A08120 [Tetrapisispora blattae CBS 6284]CCH58602.1 hypothetical protein TBLA_0A08120 [Tetrapisispora blattae CBS 6284]
MYAMVEPPSSGPPSSGLPTRDPAEMHKSLQFNSFRGQKNGPVAKHNQHNSLDFNTQVYSAKYSGVDVYEYLHPTGSIMKRKTDNWVNATHILKAAHLPKAKRTRILERQILNNNHHEKVQGGFGKYQGTWIPLEDAVALAREFGVYDEIQPLFEFVHSPNSPPPPMAPKHRHAHHNSAGSANVNSISTPASFTNTKGGTTIIADSRFSKKIKRRKSIGGIQRKLGSSKNLSLSISPTSSAPSSNVSSPPNTRRRKSSGNATMSVFKPDSKLAMSKTSPVQPPTTPISSPKTIFPATPSDSAPATANQNSNSAVARKSSNVSLTSPLIPLIPRYSNKSKLTMRRRSSTGLPFLSTSSSTSMLPSGASSLLTDIGINDKVNDYLSKLIDFFLTTNNLDSKLLDIPVELLLPPSNSSPYIDSPIDNEYHTAFHWACAMGVLPIIQALYDIGVNIRAMNYLGQTALIKSILFQNCYQNKSFPIVFQLLHETVFDLDNHLQSCIHYLMKKTSRSQSAKYYLDVILSKLNDIDRERLLNLQDFNGDTALHIANRNHDEIFIRILLENGALQDRRNKQGLAPNDPPKTMTNKPSIAAKTLIDTIPNIVTSLNNLSHKYKDYIMTSDENINELNQLIKTLKLKIEHYRFQTMNNMDISSSDGKDIDDILNLKEHQLDELKTNLIQREIELKDILIRLQHERIMQTLRECDGSSSRSSNDQVLIKKLDAMKKLQFVTIDKILAYKVQGENSKLMKYRSIISSGAQVPLNEVDSVLDRILAEAQ